MEKDSVALGISKEINTSSTKVNSKKKNIQPIQNLEENMANESFREDNDDQKS